MQKVDLTGIKFSMLTVLKEIEPLNGKKRYLCVCDCGNKIEKSYSNLKGVNGNQSCGCMTKKWISEAQTTHGDRYTRLYRIWQGIKSRSVNSKTFTDRYNQNSYKEKQIKCCKEWLDSYQSFKDWAITSGYQDDLTIDRIDNSGNYEPNNCQWITAFENSTKDSIGVSNKKCVKLSDKEIEAVKQRLKQNESCSSIARDFNVDRTTINRIKLKRVCYA